MNRINFASDNYTGIHPDIITAITTANNGPAIAYGGDDFTQQAIAQFKTYFGQEIDVFFVFNGTAANVTALCAMMKSHEAVICAETAHIQADECGAPEKIVGCKLLLVKTEHGKLTVDDIRQYLHRVGDQHHVQPRVISISQSTEYGTVYTANEIKDLAEFARANYLYLHMDGARLANAAASLRTDFKTMTQAAGVDVLSFGGTKNGMMLGEAVIFFNSRLAKDFLFIRKQNMQLASKMRFIAAQFQALLSHDLWLKNADHANKMAKLLAEQLKDIPSVQITHPVEANAVFAVMPKVMIEKLQLRYYFHVWNTHLGEVRLMTAFDTREEDIYSLITDIKETSLD